MLNIKQLHTEIVRPVLAMFKMGGLAAERLVIGTGLAESRLEYIKQVGRGPALGIYQMEPETERDIWKNYLIYNPELKKKVETFVISEPSYKDLVFNLAYATIMCRLQYYRHPTPLPSAEDLDGMAAMWKKLYNTEYGAGTVAGFKKKAALVMELVV